MLILLSQPVDGTGFFPLFGVKDKVQFKTQTNRASPEPSMLHSLAHEVPKGSS